MVATAALVACSSPAPPAVTKPAPPPPAPPAVAPKPAELAFEQQVVFSPDGVWLLFSRRIIDRARWEAEKYKALGGTQYDLYVVRADGGGLRQLTHTPESSETWVAWSPDGRSIAYSVEADNGTSLFVMNADGSGGHRLVKDASAPAWSPDGKRLAFMRKLGEHTQIFTCAADGSDERQVTSGDVGYAHPQWSPDGAWLVTQSDRKGQGKDQIARISAGGSRTTYLTDDENNNFYPSFTPDGQAIAFTSERDGGTQNVYVARDGAPPERTIAGAWLARWSPKGDRVAYIAGKFPDSAIYVRDAAGGDAHQIAD